MGIVQGEVSSEIRGSTKERRQLPGYIVVCWSPGGPGLVDIIQ